MNDINKINELCLFKGQQVNYKLEDPDLNSQLEKDNYVILKKLTQYVNNKYYYYLLIKCKNCGEIKKINKSDWNNQRIRKCRTCLSIDKKENFVGFENKTYKVISVNYDKSNQNKRKIYYNVVCKNCGAKLVLRKDAIKADTINGKCCKCMGNNKTPTSDVIYNVSYNRYKQGALSRGFNFDLSKEDFKDLVSKNCTYCGSSPSEISSLKRYNKTGTPICINGIDRINSNLGYTKENCVSCCEFCNRIKLNYNLDFFYKHIEKIYNHHKSLTTISKESTTQANGVGSGGPLKIEDDIV